MQIRKNTMNLNTLRHRVYLGDHEKQSFWNILLTLDPNLNTGNVGGVRYIKDNELDFIVSSGIFDIEFIE